MRRTPCIVVRNVARSVVGIAILAGGLFPSLVYASAAAPGAGSASSTLMVPDAPAAAGYSDVILADHPDIYWRLGELGGTTASDSSGKGRDGTYGGDPVLGVPGAIKGDPDTAVKLDGVDDSVSWQPARRQSLRGPFSVEAWVRSGRATGERAFVSTRWTRDYTFDIKMSDFDRRGIRVDVGDGSIWYVTETLAFDWERFATYHIVAVATMDDVTLYVDGVSIGTVDYSCSDYCRKPLFYGPKHRVQVGQNDSFNEWFTGRVDEVAVYRYALTPEQVAAHYAAGR
jgi:hypothetical protein